MKLNKIITGLALLSSIGIMSQAHAAGTLAGTSITNTANLAFAIGGIAQTPQPSNTVSFRVDNKVNLLVTEENGAPTLVSPGGTDFVTRFKVTNLGNSEQDYNLKSIETFTFNQTLFGKNNNFNIGNGTGTTCKVVADRLNTGTLGEYDSGDTVLYIARLAPDVSRYVFVICSIAATAVNGDFALVGLTATTVAAGGGVNNTTGAVPLSATAGADTTNIDRVFADVDGSDDSNRDGKHSARSAYLVQSPVLSVVKTTLPICDPLNFTNNPKNIPGAYVRYAIEVTNDPEAGASAVLNTLSDTLLVANLSLDQNLIAPTASSCGATTPPESATGRSFKITCTGGSRVCATTPQYKTYNSDSDGATFTTPTATFTMTQALAAEAGYTAGELKAGESVKIEFNTLVK